MILPPIPSDLIDAARSLRPWGSRAGVRRLALRLHGARVALAGAGVTQGPGGIAATDLLLNARMRWPALPSRSWIAIGRAAQVVTPERLVPVLEAAHSDVVLYAKNRDEAHTVLLTHLRPLEGQTLPSARVSGADYMAAAARIRAAVTSAIRREAMVSDLSGAQAALVLRELARENEQTAYRLGAAAIDLNSLPMEGTA